MTETTKLTYLVPIRIADHPALDFANTLATPSGVTVDFIAQPQAFIAWAEGTLGAEDVFRMAKQAEENGELEISLREVLSLRAWLRQILPMISAGEALPDECVVARLNDSLAKGCSQWHLVTYEGQVRACLEAIYCGPSSVPAALAVLIANLLTEVNHKVVRKCENAACSLWFRDTSKRGIRRWCCMNACGNRAKAAAHRERKKMEQSTKASPNAVNS